MKTFMSILGVGSVVLALGVYQFPDAVRPWVIGVDSCRRVRGLAAQAGGHGPGRIMAGCAHCRAGPASQASDGARVSPAGRQAAKSRFAKPREFRTRSRSAVTRNTYTKNGFCVDDLA